MTRDKRLNTITEGVEANFKSHISALLGSTERRWRTMSAKLYEPFMTEKEEEALHAGRHDWMVETVQKLSDELLVEVFSALAARCAYEDGIMFHSCVSPEEKVWVIRDHIHCLKKRWRDRRFIIVISPAVNNLLAAAKYPGFVSMGRKSNKKSHLLEGARSIDGILVLINKMNQKDAPIYFLEEGAIQIDCPKLIRSGAIDCSHTHVSEQSFETALFSGNINIIEDKTSAIKVR